MLLSNERTDKNERKHFTGIICHNWRNRMIRRIVNFNIDANQISNAMLSYQGEHLATELRIHLPDKLLSSDCTYKLLFLLPNGESKYAILKYTSGYLKFLIPQALTMLIGKIKVQLIISDKSNTIIKSRTQEYTIVSGGINNTIKEVDNKYVGLLDDTILECKKAIETCIAKAKNAYQIAVENGFAGTVEEWLESLKGADGRGIISSEINANGELVLTYSDGSAVNVGVVKGKNGSDYVLTDTDKTEIANIVINEYDSSLMAILGGDSSATE